MDSVIRKISIGSDYKNDAMHYSIGQEVYGGHIIKTIIFEQNNMTSITYSDPFSKIGFFLKLFPSIRRGK